MANWKKVIVSGSHAHLANITASGDIHAIGKISSSAELFASLSLSDSTIASQAVMYDTSSGKFYFTGSGTGGGTAVGFPYSGSDVIGGGGLQAAVISGSLVVGGGLGGNITASGGISAGGDIIATNFSASGVSSSFLSASNADIINISVTRITSSFVSGNIISASNIFVNGDLKATGDVDANTFSIGGITLLDNQNNVISGSNIFGSQSNDTHQFTGSLLISGAVDTNLVLVAGLVSASGFSGSLFGTAATASFVTTAQTASYVETAQTASYVETAQTASFVATAQTASYVENAQTASFVATAQTASYVETAQTASFVAAAQTASFVATAQTASFVATAQTASFVASAVSSSHAEEVTIGTPVANDARLPLVFLDTDGVLKVGDVAPDQDGPTYNVNTNKLELGRAGEVGIELFGGNNDASTAFIRVKGDLFVEGATTTLNVANLAVEDKFILLNSHSAATPAVSDAGIIVQTSGSEDGKQYGAAVYYSQDQNRWVLAKSSSVEAGAGTISQNDGFIVSVTSSTLPVTAAYDPQEFNTNMQFGGGTAASYGMMYIDEGETGREAGLFIYMPGDLG